MSFLQGKPASAKAGPGDAARPNAAAFGLDWQATIRAGRSCCCTAKPMVVAIIPPTSGRPEPTDLLLCWHHYRAGRKVLAAGGAMVMTMDGKPIAGAEWPPPAAADPPARGGRAATRSGR